MRASVLICGMAAMALSLMASLPHVGQASAGEAARIAADTVDWQAAPIRMLMVEQEGCIYCEAWDREIGPGFPNSSEGKAAPLLRVDIDGPWPDGIALERRPTITPTFILLNKGQELARLEGYPGENYFYPVIGDMLAKAGIASTGDKE